MQLGEAFGPIFKLIRFLGGNLTYINTMLWSGKPRGLAAEFKGEISATLAFLPALPDLDIRALYRRPGDAMCGLFRTILASMGRKGMIESLPVNILCVRRQVRFHRCR